MLTRSINLEFPIDFILETKEGIVACGYKHVSTGRTGALYLLSKDKLEIIRMVRTSGTLQAFYKNDKIYTANVSDITVFSEKLDIISIKQIPTFSTCIFVASDEVYVGDTNGNIYIFDDNLNIKSMLKLTKEPIWVIKCFENILYLGDESGVYIKYDLEEHIIKQQGKRKEGIIDIFLYNKILWISSYDENLIGYDEKTFEELKYIDKTGTLWRSFEKNEKIISSCIYDGVKIFDNEFNLIHHIETESICYAICSTTDKLIWAPFYSNSILWCDIKFLCD
ncbi:hypothetical protein GINT2_000049 [Glugoides intestinalis]